MSDVKLVLVSQLGVNDEKADLVSWEVSEGSSIEKGDVLCILETTKAAYDVESDYSGFIAFLSDEDDKVLVNNPIAIIASSYEQAVYERDIIRNKAIQEKMESDTSATKKAESIAKENKVSLKDITPSTGSIIRESDVLEYIQANSVTNKKVSINFETNKIPVAVYGAGLGGVTIRETLSMGDVYKVVCYIDDNKKLQSEMDGVPVYSGNSMEKILNMGVKHAITGVSNGILRTKIAKKIVDIGFELVNAIHPSSYISPSAKIGVNNHIKAGSLIDTNTIIGNNCIIDNGVIIAHDNLIEDGCHIAPGAVFGSKIHLGKNTVIGIGASISTNIKIGQKCIISVGAAITQNIDNFSVVDGVPGRVIGKTKG